MKLSDETSWNIVRRWMEDNTLTDYADGYGEPGYGFIQQPEAVLIGDLHELERRWPKIVEQLTYQGFEFEFYDEWIVEHNHSRAYRTSPSSYLWQPSFVIVDGELLTIDDDLTEWIEWATERVDEPVAIPGHIVSGKALEDEGFTLWGEGENGFHEGMNDNPTDQYDQVREQYGNGVGELEILFRMDDVGQFHMRYQCWYRLACGHCGESLVG